MLGFQSPALEVELAKAVRLADIEAAERFRVRRRVRRRPSSGSTVPTNRGGIAAPARLRQSSG